MCVLGLIYIAFAVSQLSRYIKNPGIQRWKAAQHGLKYLMGIQEVGITYGWDQGLIGFADSDWAGNTMTRNSTTGFVFMLNGGPISWSSRLEKTVALK